jgi:hypothetical protein
VEVARHRAPPWIDHRSNGVPIIDARGERVKPTFRIAVAQVSKAG